MSGFVFAGFDEVLHLHLFELARAKDEVTGRHFVAKRFADLRDPEGQLAAAGVQHVEEVNEDALRGFGTKIDERLWIIFRGCTDMCAKHEIERARLSEICRTATRTLPTFKFVRTPAAMTFATIYQRIAERIYSAASPWSSLSRSSPWTRAFSTSRPSSMMRRIWVKRAMSTKFPPKVELMRLRSLKTWHPTSSMRREARMPQTWAFLPNTRMSGFIAKCSYAQNLPVRPTPVWISSRMNRSACSSQIARRAWKNSGRKWLSPPSPWIGSMIRAAISSPSRSMARRISSRATFSIVRTAARFSPVSGKVTLGLTMRGQENFGKNLVLRGSKVLVRERL